MPRVTLFEVQTLLPALPIVDSRIADWKIKLPDTRSTPSG